MSCVLKDKMTSADRHTSTHFIVSSEEMCVCVNMCGACYICCLVSIIYIHTQYT